MKRRGDYIPIKGILDTSEKIEELRMRLEEETKKRGYQDGIDY